MEEEMRDVCHMSKLGLAEFAKERSTGSTMHAERDLVLATALRRLLPMNSCITQDDDSVDCSTSTF